MAAQSWGRRFARFFHGFWRVLRMIFHESMGAIFLVMALFWGFAAMRQWSQGGETWAWAALGGVALVFAGFGLSSFRSARRVR
jgi:hypothetical protein